MELALSLKPVEHAFDLSPLVLSSRVVCLLFPRRIVRGLAGVPCRFYDLSLSKDGDPQHTRDIMFTAFLMKTLQLPGIVANWVERAFVDDRNASVVSFILVLKASHGGNALSLNKFADEMRGIINSNHAALFGPADAAAQAGQAPAKKRRINFKDTTPNLRKAHTLVMRPLIPVYEICSTAPFNTSMLPWGDLITTVEELQTVLLDVARQRHVDLDSPCVSFSFGQPSVTAAPAHTAVGQMEVDVGDSDTDAPGEVEAAEEAAEEDRFTLTFVFGDGSHQNYNVSLEKLLCIDHKLVKRFLSDDVASGSVPARTRGVWELARPVVDLPHLHERYLADSEVYDQFALYASRARARKDALEANPRGDLSILSSFFAENCPLRDDDPKAAARLVYDVMTRPDSRLPKAWIDTMGEFVETLDKNSNILPLCTEKPVRQYANLAYSGNYALHVLQQFELLGTFHFHVEQFITMLVLDGVVFRPKHEDDGDDQSNVGMCANILNYGPPGIGKSTASLFFLTAFRNSYVTNTYSSMRSIYSNLPSSDFLNGKASYNDEAPAWIPENSHTKSAPQERDMIAHLKERLSSGKMNGERLVRDDSKGVHKTINFNVDVQNAPMVMNTNAPERSGHSPLLERFICRYYMFGARAVPHTLVVGAEPLGPEVKTRIRKEFSLMRTLLMIASTLQTDGLLSFPCTLVFKSYYSQFLERLKKNPWLDCQAPNPGDRRSSIIEIMYGFLVTRLAIHRLFLEPGGKHHGRPFSIENMLDLQAEMASGDIQCAILAIGAYSHNFRSPTEYRVAELISSLLLKRLRREYKSEAAKQAEGADFFATEPEHVTAYSPHQESVLCDAVGDHDGDLAQKLLGDLGMEAWQQLPRPRLLLGSRYLPLMDVVWTNGQLTNTEAYGVLAHNLLEGHSSNTLKIMEEHAQKRIGILAKTGAACGPDTGHSPLLFCPDSGSRRTRVFVLVSWIMDATVTHLHSVHDMLKAAAFDCGFTSPGTYMTLEPYVLRRGEVAACGDAEGVVPSMLQQFVVPVHEASCPARDEATERSRPPVFAPRRHSSDACTCFRSRRTPAKIGDESVCADPHLVALAKFQKKCPAATLPPSCRGEALVYPEDKLKAVCSVTQGERGAVREANEAEERIMQDIFNSLATGDGD